MERVRGKFEVVECKHACNCSAPTGESVEDAAIYSAVYGDCNVRTASYLRRNGDHGSNYSTKFNKPFVFLPMLIIGITLIVRLDLRPDLIFNGDRTSTGRAIEKGTWEIDSSPYGQPRFNTSRST